MFDTKPYEERFKQTIARFEDELKKVRTGRAHPSQLDGIKAEVYGVLLPLNQVASIAAPEAQLLQITPFDPNNIQAITAAIRADQSLGFNPSDDGHTIRILVPALTEERRKQMVKQASEKVEEARIMLRNIRQEALKEAKHKKEAKMLSEDNFKVIEKDIDRNVVDANTKIDEIFLLKERDILKI
ncbi:MAG TPA: ribosome recycling factor [Candidatus Saccharimonadales bacterium]|nr:ribosome recycling factor [Candidatus Saccharimonadales bacterium]